MGKLQLAGMAVLVAAAAAGQSDPPSRVARLNYISGAVSFQPGSVDRWVPATLNYPLTTGDHLWTDPTAAAELHISSTAVRLAAETSFSFLNLDDRTVQIRVAQGAVNVKLNRLGEDESFELDTPNGAVSLLRPGEYRVDVSSDGSSTRVTVRGGEAEVTAGSSAFAVRVRQSATIRGADSPAYDLTNAGPTDEWDRWCMDRDRREERAQSARYVSRDVIGYEDLDDYGEWRTFPAYGPVWVPARAVAGWAPYRFGHWAWVAPWGWTWIDDAPWGFAPFHYGRWAFYGGAWGWVPGPIGPAVVVRPVYAPALVAFVGGSNWGVSVSFVGGGGVGWFPLAPGEVYVPAYRVSPAYVNRINVTHITNVTNITNINTTNVTNVRYVNRTVPGAVTAVSHENFVSSRPVATSAVAVSAQAAAAAPVVAAAPVAPRPESVLAHSAPPARVAQPPASALNRQVMGRRTPPAPPVPFARHEQALQANPGRPLDAEAASSLRREAPPMHPLVRPSLRPENRPVPAGTVSQPPRPVSRERPEPEFRPRPAPNVEPRREQRLERKESKEPKNKKASPRKEGEGRDVR